MSLPDAHGNRIAAEAASWIGTPYRHQASRKGVGTDCLGLVRGVWRSIRGAEPRRIPPYDPWWDKVDASEPLLSAARTFLLPATTPAPKAGEVLLFRMHRLGPVKHCGIHLGGDRFVHAYDGRRVTASSFSAFWCNRLVARFVIPPKEEEGP